MELILIIPKEQLENYHWLRKLAPLQSYFGGQNWQQQNNGLIAIYARSLSELTRPTILEIREQVQQQLQGEFWAVDHLLDRKKPSFFAFDMDSTVIEQEVIDELARQQGVFAAVAEVTEQAMQGKLEFAEALRQRCRCLQGLKVDALETVYQNLKFQPGILNLFQFLKQQQSKLAIYSGGFTTILAKVAADYRIDYYAANHLEQQQDKLTGEVVGQIVGPELKKQLFIAHREQNQIETGQSVAIGDGSNDVFMLKAAGIGIGYHPKQGLKAQIDNWTDKLSHHCFEFLFAPA